MAASSIQAARGRPGVNYFRPGVTAITLYEETLCVASGFGGSSNRMEVWKSERSYLPKRVQGLCSILEGILLDGIFEGTPILLHVDPPITSI